MTIVCQKFSVNGLYSIMYLIGISHDINWFERLLVSVYQHLPTVSEFWNWSRFWNEYVWSHKLKQLKRISKQKLFFS